MARHSSDLSICQGSTIRMLFTKHKNTTRSQAKENEIHRHDIVQNLLITPPESDNNCQQPLQRDCDYRGTRFWMHRAHTLEEKSIFGHGKIDARRSQHALTEKADSRNGDTGSDRASAKTSQCSPHYFGGRRSGGSKSIRSQSS